MRVDPFTKIYSFSGKVLLASMRTGAIDQVSQQLAETVTALRKTDSFSSADCTIYDALLDQIIKKGYVTHYSDQELLNECIHVLETYKEKQKTINKIPTVIIDSTVARNWCSDDASHDSEWQMTLGELNQILTIIRKKQFSNEVNLWINVRERSNMELQQITETLTEHNITIAGIYMNDYENKNITKLIEKISLLPHENYTIYIKEDKYVEVIKPSLSFGGYKIHDSKKVPVFCQDMYFFCPFLYKTYFIDKSGNMHYCVSKLTQGKDIRINLINYDNAVSSFDPNMFHHLCNLKTTECAFSFYCFRGCDFLKRIRDYKPFNGAESCTVANGINNTIKQKLELLLKEEKH